LLTPVRRAIKGRIINAEKINMRPSTVKVSVFLALSAFFASPPEVTNLNPLRIIMNTAAIPARIRSQKMILPTITGKQLRVAVPLSARHPLFCKVCHIKLA
jgi:hypothetical protein